MKVVPPIKKLEEAQPKKVLTMCQFENESKETKVIFFFNGSESGRI